MSAVGHSRRFRPASRKSALPLKADFIADMPDVGFVPIGDIARPYSITSSAVAIRVGGLANPSIQAV